MRVALIADAFPPLRSSGAVQLRDLSRELVRQGHDVVAMVAAPEIASSWHVDRMNGVTVLRLRTSQTKGVGRVRRMIGEFRMPFAMLRALRQSPFADTRFDAIIWYSPTIFLGPMVKALKRRGHCPAYLIVRDIFPQWAADTGLISRGLIYHILDRVARHQYAVADCIGVQTPGNLPFFDSVLGANQAQTEVLENWLAESPVADCTIDLRAGPLAERRIFVYAGNMGVAQDADILIRLAVELKHREDCGFLFVGRGSEVARLQAEARQQNLDNVLFHDEIDPDEIRGLYAQCQVGLISLDLHHKTHNIPGKFLSYMQAGLPVLARINAGNDLVATIRNERVGRVTTSIDPTHLAAEAIALLDDVSRDPGLPGRCRRLWTRKFSVESAARQVMRALAPTEKIQTAASTAAAGSSANVK
jgi:glycosyltransferase involved in cell wall biosynthesis